jgi:phage terminase large subunit GpA-like protein
VEKLLAEAAAMWTPPPDLTVSQWADEYRYLSPESSAEPGRWRTERTPYLREPMDAVTDATVREVVLMVGSQVGKTEVLNNVAGYYISQDPAPILVIQPTLTMAKTWSEDRFAPMLRDSPVFAGKVKDPRSRDSGNTVFHKQFPGGHITVAGANSAAGLASRPIRVLLFDEVDRYPPSAGTEGDPVTLARKRSATFWNRKIVMVSSPTRKDASRIEQAYEQSDKRQYHVICPHCSHEQILRWSHVRGVDKDPETAHIICQDCGVMLDDDERCEMVKRGRWVATSPFRGVAGYWMSGLYSPWQRISDMVGEFLAAKDHPETLMAWTNTTLAELWDERGDSAQPDALAARAEEYPLLFVPDGGLLLTAGVDVQHDRVAITLAAWGEREECWIVGWTEIFGSPATPELWARVDEYLEPDFVHESGGRIRVAAIAVDEGDGVTTNYVRDYCRARHARPIPRLNIKGSSTLAKQLLNKPERKGKPWMVDVSTIKGALLPRLKMTEPRLIHFSNELPADYYPQLTSESLVRRYVKGFVRLEWVKDRKVRNEGLDTLVYAYAAALYMSLKSRNWPRVRKMIEATAPGEPAQEAEPPATTQPMQQIIGRPGRSTNWVNGFRP